ncbi:sodium:proton antiporter [Luteimicrobium xylanilyticum]|uniref:Sodium, potassium, lithium and rubidium/H(+) antiporter n=1 Tax=Luteimicrobium xylanilyticum TaxID=1133546 RepID=A0A5P9QEC4_9MICO|nr:cation:proton antiporter [Luteimicrobium xylanilyticum]QFU99814.1 Sodium, potassium, lithium and rubidium/H(+) antiporter [Luteimicrobium xylanilyticum]
MTELLVVIVCGLLVIAAATVFGPRLGVAAPLVLVAVGVAASFVPAFGAVEIEPEWILEGVLPPLLYSSAVSMPAMNFRREFGAISGLSVVLVVASSLVLGLFFSLVIPGIGLAWGVALGAIVSPTDAVATSIIKQTSVSKRVVAMLDGESLLNDATALVILRTAIVATAASFSFWGALGTFAYSVVVAVVVGGVVGWLNLVVRRRVTDATVNTVISFTVPFVAAVPAEALGASGLVAAVVAGLATGVRAPRQLSPENRLSDTQNWRTVELVLEGAVFLTMGVQLKEVVTRVEEDHAGVGTAVLVALGALVITVLVRAVYVSSLLVSLARRARRREKLQPRLVEMQEKMTTPEGKQEILERASARPGRRPSESDLDRFAVRITRGLADVEYFLREPLGWREGTAVVWAGMRGAVTVAAAQTLPDDTPQRSVLVLVAYTVAALSLLLQGGTIGPLLRRLAPQVDQAAAEERASAERTRLFEILRSSSADVAEPPVREGEPRPEQFAEQKRYRLEVIAAQRAALLDARDDGTFDADLLEDALSNLDADEIAIDLRGRLAG